MLYVWSQRIFKLRPGQNLKEEEEELETISLRATMRSSVRFSECEIRPWLLYCTAKHNLVMAVHIRRVKHYFVSSVRARDEKKRPILQLGPNLSVASRFFLISKERSFDFIQQVLRNWLLFLRYLGKNVLATDPLHTYRSHLWKFV